MGIQWRGPVPQSNYTAGRDGNVVELIVDHWTVVMFEGAVRRRSVLPNADVSGPDVETGQSFKV